MRYKAFLFCAILITLGYFCGYKVGVKSFAIYHVDSVSFIYDSDLIQKCDEALILNFQLNDSLRELRFELESYQDDFKVVYDENKGLIRAYKTLRKETTTGWDLTPNFKWVDTSYLKPNHNAN